MLGPYGDTCVEQGQHRGRFGSSHMTDAILSFVYCYIQYYIPLL